MVVLYAAIDHVAWLADETNVVEKIGNKGFKAWVQKYMLDKSPDILLGATASDIWGARSGVLHTGAPENDESRLGKAREIYYYTKLQPKSSGATIDSDGVLYLSLNQLGTAFAIGVDSFLKDLLADTERSERVRTKLGRTLIFKPC